MKLTSEQVAKVCRAMLSELASMRLGVCKIKTDGGYVRAVVSHNAPWYQWFCGQWVGLRGQRGGRCRRPRTIIRRGNTIETLKRMIDGDCGGLYAERLMEAAEWYILNMGEPSDERDSDDSGGGSLWAGAEF